MTTITDRALRRTELREKDGQFCRIEIKLRPTDHGPELSICGTAGYIVTPAQAKREALEYWRSYFDDEPGEIIRLGRRTANGAAKYVLDVDGEYHGLDVLQEDGRKVYISHSVGQIVDELREWFPEYAQYLPYHLNGMHAECAHQRSRGETWQTHPSAKCAECGYVLGSAWLYEPLPDHVIVWAVKL
jgi:hypothetical protein